MFVHLRLHSEFSVVDGTVRLDDAVATASRLGQPALALTDLGNVFGGVKFYRAARGKGIKPILGAEVVLEGLGADTDAHSRLLLLVQKHRWLPQIGLKESLPFLVVAVVMFIAGRRLPTRGSLTVGRLPSGHTKGAGPLPIRVQPRRS